MTKIITYIKDFYTGVFSFLFTLGVALPGILLASMVAGLIVRLVVVSFMYFFK